MNKNAPLYNGKKLFMLLLTMLFFLVAISLRAEEAEEQRARHTLESMIKVAPSGIGFLKNRVMVQVNDHVLNLTGYTREELIGKSTRMLYPSQTEFEHVGKAYQLAIMGGSTSLETLWLRKDGTIRNVIISLTLLDHSDISKGVVSTVLDITDRKEAEEALVARTRWSLAGAVIFCIVLVFLLARLTASLKLQREAAVERYKGEAKYRTIVENTSDIIYSLKPDGIFTFVSPSCTRNLGHTIEEVDGRSYTGIIHPDDLTICSSAIQKILETGDGVKNVEYRVRHKNGEWRWLSSSSQPVKDSAGMVVSINGLARDITERKLAEEELRESEKRFRTIFENAPFGITITSQFNNRYVDVNDAYLKRAALDKNMVIGKTYSEIGSVISRDFEQLFLNSKDKRLTNVITDIVEWNGEAHTIMLSTEPITINAESCILSITVDITEQQRAEKERERLTEQLHQSQKMDAIGQLAGGIAHDFNNMLGAIIGQAELSLLKLDRGNPLYTRLTEILKAANRSAVLTRQLLAFARKQAVQPIELNLNETVEDMLKMLQRLIGEDIDMVWQPAGGLWPVVIDPGQINQILTNLCVNARDAVSGTGKVTIETGNAVFDESYCVLNKGFVPGEYVMLSVSDNGCGMNEQILGRIFEPFFTTKETGKGTGLGLATVYGIVRQNNGFINVYSEPGLGTIFKIYLPRNMEMTAPDQEESRPWEPERGSETILVVEDEPILLETTTGMLEDMGYTVLGASSPGDAVRLIRECSGKVDLLITDVIMPEMNGKELVSTLKKDYPQLKVLFTSGYTASVIAGHGVLDKGMHFIQKPFSITDLSSRIREVLGA